LYSFFANHEIDQQLVFKDLDQMNKDEFKEYDLKHQMAMLSIKLVKCFNCKQIDHFLRECRAQGAQTSNNYHKYKSKEAGKDGSDSKAMVFVDGSIDWDKQTEESNTEPRSLENFSMIAGIKLESDDDSKGEVVSADTVISADVFISAGLVAAAAVSPQSETEFALMGLSTEGSASEVSLLDGVKGLVATVDGNAYTVTEASIRSALQLDDINAIDTLTNAEIFDGLRAIRYAIEGKFTFFKNKFSPQWKFLIHTLIHCLSPKSGSWNQFASNIAIALICLSTGRKYNFSNLIFNGEPALVQTQPQEVSPPPRSPVVEPHPLTDPMPSPPRQSSPPPILFGPAPSSGVASTDPILDIPSSSRPSELPVYPDQYSKQEISPTSLDVVLTLSQSKTRARAAKIIYKRLKKQQSSSGLDFLDAAIPFVRRVSAGGADPAVVVSAGCDDPADVVVSASGADPADVVVSAGGADSTGTFISAGVSVAVGPSVPSAPLSPIRDPAKGKAIDTPSSSVTAPSNKELADQQAVIFEAERQELLEQELKQSLDAEQVYLDSLLALNLTNEKWIGLVDQVWANLILSVELLGADVSEDTFSVRMVDLMNQWQKAIADMKAKAKRDKPMTPAQQKEYMRAFKLKSSHNTEQSAELRDTTSVSISVTIAADDPEAEFKKYLRQVFDDDEPAEPVSLSLVSDIRTWEIIPTEFGLGEIYVITRADGTVKRFSTLRELMHWVGRADLMVLYGMVSDKYKLERATGIGLGLWLDLRTLITAREDQDASIIWDDQDQLVFIYLLDHQSFNNAKCKGFKDDPGASSFTFKISMLLLILLTAVLSILTLYMMIYYWKLDNKQVTI
nr:ribonuclease H-like domain, reverse transcriptase, RNA-dependent DNA polymerase [Tanacetum cinerariifolium]